MRTLSLVVGLAALGWALALWTQRPTTSPVASAQDPARHGPTLNGLPLGSWVVVSPPTGPEGPHSGRLMIALSGVSWLSTDQRTDAVLTAEVARTSASTWRLTWRYAPWKGGALTWDVTRVDSTRGLRITPTGGQPLTATWAESVRSLPGVRR